MSGVYVGEIQFQDYSGEWQGIEWTSMYPNDQDILLSMKNVQKRLPGKRIRCIDRDSRRLVDIL